MTRKKIVVVESQEELLLMECVLLKKRGYEVYAARNGDLVVDYVKKHRADLVLMNVNMPDVNSYSLCELIKNDQSTGKIPVIFTSSANNKLDLSAGEQAGVDGYVIIPFRVTTFMDTIEKAISGELL